MSGEYSVYRIDLSDGMQYVGMTNDIERRMKEHGSSAPSMRTGVAVYRRANEGVEIAECAILASGLTRGQALETERKAIKNLTMPLNAIRRKPRRSTQSTNGRQRQQASISFDPNQLAKLRQVARKEDLSIAQVVRRVVKQFLQQAESTPKETL